MFTCSTQEKIIGEFIKWPRSKVYIHLILNTVLLPEWSTALCFCLVIVVHESLVCPEQLNCLLFFRKILQVQQILWFSSIFVYLNPFQQWLYDFEIYLFTLRDSYATITEDLNAHWSSRRKKHALRAGAWKLLNRIKMCVLPKYHIFHLVIPFRSYKR